MGNLFGLQETQPDFGFPRVLETVGGQVAVLGQGKNLWNLPLAPIVGLEKPVEEGIFGRPDLELRPEPFTVAVP
jgi:hypothetical protein